MHDAGSNKQAHPSLLYRAISTFPSYIFFALLLTSGRIYAQLPAGAIDTTAPPKTSPQDPLRTQANEALDKQDYPTALKLLTPLAEKSPTDAHLLYDLAFTQDALDQTTAAEATYRRAIAADPTYFDPHLALGLLLARGGQPHRRPRRTPHSHHPHHRQPSPQSPRLPRPRPHRPDRQPRRRQRRTPRRPQAHPRNPRRHPPLRRAGRSLRRPHRRRTAYRRLLAVDPQDHDATAALTHLLLHQQRPDQAESLLTAALAKDPDNPTLNAQLASLYEQQGKTAQAIPLAAKLHAAHPDDATLTRLLARLYSRNQQYDQAAPLYASLLNKSTQDPTLLDYSADVQIHLKNFAEAEALLKRAIAHPEAFPNQDDLAQAASHLAFAASANNDPTTTLQALDIRGRVLPQSPSSLFLAATAHDKLHHTKQATDLYKQFLSVANGQFPDEEWEARHRLVTLANTK